MPTIRELYPIPAEIERLWVFLGDWHGEGVLKAGGDTMKVAGRWRFVTAAGGWGVRVSMESVIEGFGDYALDSLFGIDTETGTLHIYSLTNMAETHDHTACWSDETTLHGRYDGLKGGKPFREDFTIRVVRPGAMTLEYVERIDGLLDSTMTIHLTKQLPG
ncbi:hypothetical protein ABH15_00010 [Methanoculleus taiwanensis]|uniref:DUF1579 domain-containing protein n=1 Tax=Methanoculleus taiwanensis TaxID=1550565 RepID=A0A498H2D1_9EURY|nr:hypothetical protein [Methanoculleus taiwanensis]RXE56617.1 hypothetical protein ABH15_00010 [Methanoculleus taiwanensis]